MQVHTDTGRLPAFRNAVVTIGTFDGVHLGHQKIIAQLKQEAAETGGETVIVTFHPHPRMVVSGKGKKLKLITTIGERTRLLRDMGIDHLVVVPFTKQFSELPPRAYVEDFLVGKFHPAAVIIGYDHRFGRDRQGDYKLLEAYSARGVFRLKEIPRQVINDNAISSTAIREAVENGDIETANRLLGYDFFFEAVVVSGDRRGRTIGFPTANLHVEEPEKLIPKNGVYAVTASLYEGPGAEDGSHRALPPGGETGFGGPFASGITGATPLPGMMNIGIRPTVGGETRTVEAHLFDFSEEIYGTRMHVSVRKFLREEKKFGGLGELKEQLGKDREAALRALEDNPAPGK